MLVKILKKYWKEEFYRATHKPIKESRQTLWSKVEQDDTGKTIISVDERNQIYNESDGVRMTVMIVLIMEMIILHEYHRADSNDD